VGAELTAAVALAVLLVLSVVDLLP